MFNCWVPCILWHIKNGVPLCENGVQIANLISKLNFYKLIPYPMDNCFTGRRDRSRQTSEKDVLYIIPAGPARRVHSQVAHRTSSSCLDIVTS